MAAELATIESLTQRVQSRTAFRDHPALILNADYRPLSYFPLSIWPWQDAIKAVFLDRVNIVSEYETEVHSPNHTMRLPSVVSLREYVQPARYPAFTRFNLFLRDEFTCQYCGVQGDLTFDHVIPRSRGGRTTWDNVVAACSSCNLRKANHSLAKSNMNLRRKAFRPSAMQLQNIGRKFPPNHLHGSWLDYLYWDTELEG
jgi:5-methylcytosine-specific restriction endonuclease McrA